MSLTQTRRSRAAASQIVIDVRDYIDIPEFDLIEPEDAIRLRDALQRAHGILAGAHPNVAEALIYLERALPIAEKAAKEARKEL